MFNDTIKDTLERADALERHVMTVTMRAESLATTDADFFKTLVNRQEKPRTTLTRVTHQKPPEFQCRNALEMSFSALPSVPNS